MPRAKRVASARSVTGRPDGGELLLFEEVGRARVFGEEGVSGMHRGRAGYLARRDDLRNVQIAVLGGGAADADAFIGEPDMHGVSIGGGVHGDGNNADF